MRMSEYIRHWDRTGEFPFTHDSDRMALYFGYLLAVVSLTTPQAPYEERKMMVITIVQFIEDIVEAEKNVDATNPTSNS